jgi:hypothetical protein
VLLLQLLSVTFFIYFGCKNKKNHHPRQNMDGKLHPTPTFLMEFNYYLTFNASIGELKQGTPL